MKIPVVWLSYKEDIPCFGYWDMAMLANYFNGRLWKTVNGYEFDHRTGFEGIEDGAVVVFPARAQVDQIDRLNADIASLKWVVLILSGDEEGLFPVDKIEHPNMELWVMSAKPGTRGNPLPNGYTPQTKLLDGMEYGKTQDFYFAGQVTHSRRELCASKLKELEGGTLIETEGFTQGVDHETYMQGLASAKIAPCPSGPVTPDTFRLYEALEAGCIPIVDSKTPGAEYPDYWTHMFGEEPPFPIIRCDYDSLPAYIGELKEKYYANANKVGTWWIKFKRELAYRLDGSIERASGIKSENEQVTILMPSSPLSIHPSTAIIEETISTVRYHLPDAEIIITFDRPDGADEKYDEYIARCLWLCNHKWRNVLPLVFTEHMHQANMAREALPLVKTPVLLYVEHDAPIVTDCEIPVDALVGVVLSGEANVIRLHHEACILPDHEHLMLDTESQMVNGVPLKRTIQWSQRPHFASTAFYRMMIERYFASKEKAFIEDEMHGIVLSAYQHEGVMGWNLFRLYFYAPDGNMKRSYHLDGRKS